MAKTSKKKGKKSGQKRRERRFSTSPTFMPIWVGVVGMVGAATLGCGVFGLWILDPPLQWASYLVAAGGFGLGVALWFGQAPESAVTVGDSGIAVEDGREMLRVPWYALRSLRVVAGHVVLEGQSQKVRFLMGANPGATAWALKEAAERVPDVVDVSGDVTEKLPNPDDVKGYEQDIEDDQVTGTRCASSKKLINLEEDARLCPRCGKVYHREGLPEACVHCETKLGGRTLRA